MKPSTRALTILPPLEDLERLSMSLATLDAILSPEWQERYYSFNKAWTPQKNHRMGSMRNGCGDEYFILFTPAGAAIKGYAHEYPMARPGEPPEGMFDGFPEAITDFSASRRSPWRTRRSAFGVSPKASGRSDRCDSRTTATPMAPSFCSSC
jgi:hypothetical protein